MGVSDGDVLDLIEPSNRHRPRTIITRTVTELTMSVDPPALDGAVLTQRTGVYARHRDLSGIFEPIDWQRRSRWQRSVGQ